MEAKPVTLADRVGYAPDIYYPGKKELLLTIYISDHRTRQLRQKRSQRGLSLAPMPLEASLFVDSPDEDGVDVPVGASQRQPRNWMLRWRITGFQEPVQVALMERQRMRAGHQPLIPLLPGMR